MNERLMFFSYTFAGMLSFCAVFLMILFYRRSGHDKSLWINSLRNFQIYTLAIGMIYFAQRYLQVYRVNQVTDVLLQGADIAFFILMQFYWLRYLWESLPHDSDKIRKIVGCAAAGMIILLCLSVINYTTFLNSDYHVGNLSLQAYVAGVQIFSCIFLTLCNIGGMIYAVHFSENRNFQAYVAFTSAAVSVMCLWNGISVMYLFFGDEPSGIWSGIWLDPTPFLLLFINFLTLIYICRMGISFFYHDQQNQPQISIDDFFDTYGLTVREREIAVLAAEGRSYDEMAQLLFISKYTVKRHIHNIYEKIGISTRVELVKLMKM